MAKGTIRAVLLAGLIAGMGIPGALAGGPVNLDGLWMLVEESYGAGSKNLIADDNRVWLEFHGTGAETWFRQRSGAGYAWPAFVDSAGPLPVTTLAVVVDPVGGTAEARYRVSQDPVGGLDLEIVERYGLSEDGEALSGVVTVTFVRDGRSEGSFEMHRRFERAR